jgi:hypothetical protein
MKFLPLLLLSSAAFAEAIIGAGQQKYGESPRNMVFEFRLGPYYPLIDETLDGKPYQNTFGGAMLLGEWELERQLFQKFGSAAIGASFGYAEKYAHAKEVLTGASTGETTSIKFLPLKILGVYRFDWLAIKYGVPLVPYAKFGFQLTHWWGSKGKGTEVVDGVPAVGWSYGLTGMFGIAFLLDILDPRLARDFDTGIGVNHTYLFAEFNWAWVTDFDKRTADGHLAALDLNARFAMFGLAFEY